MITDNDMIHLRRSIELATEALEAGDQPFGSVLVDGDGHVLHEDRNRANTVDVYLSSRDCRCQMGSSKYDSGGAR